MPHAFEEKFDGIERLAKQLVPKATNLIGLANPAFLAVTFAVDTLLKFIRLGRRIREAKQEGIKNLEEKVRSEGIFRIAIPADTDLASLEDFYFDVAPMINQKAVESFKKEIADALIAQLEGSDNQLELLRFARIIISGFDHRNRRWINPRLAEHFSEVDLEDDLDYRLLTQELILFANREDISLKDVETLIPQYLILRVQAMKIDIQKLTRDEMSSINEKISDFTFNTLVGGDELIFNTTNFLLSRKKALLLEEIKKLELKRDKEFSPEMDQATVENEKQLLQQRIDELHEDIEVLESQRPEM